MQGEFVDCTNSLCMKESIIADKAYRFSVNMIRLHLAICRSEKYVYSLSNQMLRSATAIGANIEEALGGHSRRDFAAKMSIAYKEARETKYWIRLLCEFDFITANDATTCKAEIDEIIRILAAIVKSSK